ncbi:methyltransferase domain-containing protein [Roseicella aquatilis]|uniref:Methyltransferase domain-containing protein n=1 Tax=Roseicella aquatilis TaxID=2527868 RepID=A0A4R4DT83_9PROT|nr:methyltransferase domain-containing protein [Roseicella aquatilis]TCZ64813.1 methyltransferase domain-containing protein [Roseicella aquatilis]
MMQTQLRAPDVYGRTFEMDGPALAAIAERMEARGAHPFVAGVIDEYMAGLIQTPADTLLEIGCGTGAVARAIAARPEMRGPVVAVDVSPHLLETARRIAAEAGLAGRIDFRLGDAHRLDLPDGGFDVVVMHNLISHVAQPAGVLAEGRRLLRPGSGRLVVFDGDYASWTFATGAADIGAATDLAVQRGIVAHPRAMRALPRLLAEAGLDLNWSRAYVVADIGRAEFWTPSVASFRVLLPAAGTMTGPEASAFVAALERASDENRFFAACNFYTYVAQRDD